MLLTFRKHLYFLYVFNHEASVCCLAGELCYKMIICKLYTLIYSPTETFNMLIQPTCNAAGFGHSVYNWGKWSAFLFQAVSRKSSYPWHCNVYESPHCNLFYFKFSSGRRTQPLIAVMLQINNSTCLTLIDLFDGGFGLFRDTNTYQTKPKLKSE